MISSQENLWEMAADTIENESLHGQTDTYNGISKYSMILSREKGFKTFHDEF